MTDHGPLSEETVLGTGEASIDELATANARASPCVERDRWTKGCPDPANATLTARLASANGATQCMAPRPS